MAAATLSRFRPAGTPPKRGRTLRATIGLAHSRSGTITPSTSRAIGPESSVTHPRASQFSAIPLSDLAQAGNLGAATGAGASRLDAPTVFCKGTRFAQWAGREQRSGQFGSGSGLRRKSVGCARLNQLRGVYRGAKFMTKQAAPLTPIMALPGPPLYQQFQITFAQTNVPQQIPAFRVRPGASVTLFPTTPPRE